MLLVAEGNRMALLMRMGCMSRRLCREFLSNELGIIGSHGEKVDGKIKCRNSLPSWGAGLDWGGRGKKGWDYFVYELRSLYIKGF